MLPKRIIKIDGKPYLERTYLGKLFGVTFYLHRFLSNDAREVMHNHPWAWAWSFVLKGRYREEVVTDFGPQGPLTSQRWVEWFNRIGGSTFHRIALGGGCVTLMAVGPRATLEDGTPKSWGFLNGNTFEPVEPTPDDWHRDMSFMWLSDGFWSTLSREYAIERCAQLCEYFVYCGDEKVGPPYPDLNTAIRAASNHSRGVDLWLT